MADDNDKTKIRPIYSELQGMLAQAPVLTSPDEHFSSKAVWEAYNTTIDDLERIMGTSLKKYKISPITEGVYRPVVEVADYRQKLGSMIAYLYGSFFNDEAAPFKEMPATSINVSQNQTQSVLIHMLLDVSGQVERGIAQHGEGTKERTFLEKVKSSLSNVQDAAQLIKMLLQIGAELSLSAKDILKALG